MCSRRAARSITLELDDGVVTCGFKGDPAVLTASPSQISLRGTELTLRAEGRVVFSDQVDKIDCYRSDESRWGFPGGDSIQVVFPDAEFEVTAARWRQIYQQFGASPQDLQVLDEWTQEVIQAERSGRNSRDVWLQRSFSIPGTSIGVYTQSIPVSSEHPLVYDAHFSIFWNEPR
jgi:hypothetical protein